MSIQQNGKHVSYEDEMFELTTQDGRVAFCHPDGSVILENFIEGTDKAIAQDLIFNARDDEDGQVLLVRTDAELEVALAAQKGELSSVPDSVKRQDKLSKLPSFLQEEIAVLKAEMKERIDYKVRHPESFEIKSEDKANKVLGEYGQVAHSAPKPRVQDHFINGNAQEVVAIDLTEAERKAIMAQQPVDVMEQVYAGQILEEDQVLAMPTDYEIYSAANEIYFEKDGTIRVARAEDKALPQMDVEELEVERG